MFGFHDHNPLEGCCRLTLMRLGADPEAVSPKLEE